MKAKRAIYSILLILFSLILAADLAVWFLVSDGSAATDKGGSFSFTPPEGVTLPDGMSFPQDGSFPEGMTPPEGMTFPDAESGERTRRRRTERTEASDEASTASTDLPDWLPSQVQELLPYAQKIRPYRLYVLIGAVLGMVLCILRLIFMGKKIRKQREAQESEAIPLRRVALWPAFLLLLGALVLVVFLFPVNEEEKAEDGAVANTRVLSGTVEKKDLTSFIQSTGALAEQEAVSLEIPASVTIDSVCVRNGDVVTAGQIVAKANQASVMKAIVAVHKDLAEIDKKIQKVYDNKDDTDITTPVDGIVKVVYAQVGDRAMDVMNAHEALMVLSLDGCMAVKIPAAADLAMGSALIVTLPDGAELAGEVSFLEEGVATVTVVDRGYDIGTEVFVKDQAGALLGSGPLFVHKALNVTGYLGAVTQIYREEGSQVSDGDTLMSLSEALDVANSAILLKQRAEYEKELKALFQIYQDGYVHAPCDGAVEGLDEDIPYASLSDMVTGLTVRFMASGPEEADPAEYHNYIGEVLSNNGNGNLSLRIHAQEVEVSDYTALPTVATTVEGSYTVPGSAGYQFNGGWNNITVDDIWTGDKVLFTFNEEGKLMWVIVQRTEASTPPAPETPSPAPTPGPSGSPSGGHGGHGGGQISFGRSSSAKATSKPAYTIARKELCTVTPKERMLITVPIDELDVLSLSLGQEADLYLDALPTTGLTATVTEIDTAGENSGGNTKYSVTLTLDRVAQLYPGMNGTVCFPRRESKAVLTVPLAAVTEEGTRALVYTAYDQETDQLLSPVEVQTGVSDGTDVEILSGLSLGAPYYYRYADAISYVTE